MKNISDLINKKQSLVDNIIVDKSNNAYFRYLDNLLINQYFNIAKELSEIEEILTIDTYNLSKIDVINVVNSFISNVSVNKINLTKLIKISNIPNNKVISFLSKEILVSLADKILFVSRETKLVGDDFSLLRILDNFIKKIDDKILQNKFEKIKKSILVKLSSFDYIEQKNEKDHTYFCWIDRLLTCTVNNELSVSDFIKINKKLLYIIPKKTDLYWKIIHSLNYLYYQSGFTNLSELNKFKRDLLKKINEQTKFYKPSPAEIENILISVIAEPNIHKENFYYLFDTIKMFAETSQNNKYDCFNIFDYLIYIDNKRNIFRHRFIREAFFTTFYDLIVPQDNLILKEKELHLLLKLLHIDYFSYYNKKNIIDKISILLCQIGKEPSISTYKFNKYLDIADIIFSNNKDIVNMDTIDKISKSNNYKNTFKHFNLYLS